MANKLELMIEAERRGILPDNKKALLQEARKRGLIPSPQKAPEGFVDVPGPVYTDAMRPERGMSTLGAVAKGASDIPAGLAQMAAHAWPDNPVMPPKEIDDVIARREFVYQDKRGKDAGFDWGRVGGNVVASVPATTVIPGGGLLSSVAAGSLAGSFTPQTDGDFSWSEKGVQTGAGMAGGTVGHGLGKLVGKALTPRAKIPSTKELKELSTNLYKEAENAGVVVTPVRYRDMVTSLITKAKKEGVDLTIHPKATAALKRLVDEVGTPKSLQDLDILRRVVKAASKSNEEDERRIAYMMIEEIDDFIGGLKPGDVLSGDAPAATKYLTEARKLWSRTRKGEVVEDLISRADIRASQFSGSGTENALRTEFRQLAMNPKRMRLFSKEEQAAIKRVAEGDAATNFFRLVGKLAPTGVVSLGIGGGIGGYVGGPIGAVAVPAAGFASRAIATQLTKNAATQAAKVARAGGPIAADPILAAALVQRPAVLGGAHALQK